MKEFEQVLVPMTQDEELSDTWQKRLSGIWRTFKWTRSIREQAVELRTALCEQAQIIMLIQNTAMIMLVYLKNSFHRIWTRILFQGEAVGGLQRSH